VATHAVARTPTTGLHAMPVFNSSFLLLWHGQLVSQLGNQAFLIATTYFILEATGSSTIVGAVMMAATIPLALLSPFGGVLADRRSRRSIIIVTDVLRALVIGCLGLVVLWRPERSALHVVTFVLVAAFSGTMAALFTPALQAFIPDLVDREHLAAANSASQFSTQATVLVGQALGGVLYLRWGPGVLLVIDALSFAYAGLATWFIPPRTTRTAPARSLSAAGQYLAEAREGLTYVRQQPGLSRLLIVFGGVNLLFMPVFVLLPLYVREVVGKGADWYGFLLAASGAGALFGTGVAGLLLRSIRHMGAVLRVGIGVIAAAVLSVAATHDPSIALAAFAAIGCVSAIVNVTVMTILQSSVPDDVRGRVVALAVTVSTAAVPIGLGLGGVMGDLWRESLRVVFGGCAVALAMLAMIARRLPGGTTSGATTNA
jgi:DHA3 family macrolide efflux protein-like MFS transporter